jgi:hypothetical protein
MNIAQQFRDQIGRLSGALQAELDQLVASIQTGWLVEHDADGHHTDIAASGACACQQLKLRGAIEFDGRSGSGGTPLAVPAKIAYVSIITPGGTPFDIYGIRQVGQQVGDQLFVRRSPSPSSGSGIQFHDRATASATPLGTEIYLDSEVSVSYPIFHLSGVAWVPLIYSSGVGTNGTPAWVINQVVST